MAAAEYGILSVQRKRHNPGAPASRPSLFGGAVDAASVRLIEAAAIASLGANLRASTGAALVRELTEAGAPEPVARARVAEGGTEAVCPARGESGGAKFGRHRNIVFEEGSKPTKCRSDRWW